MVEEGQHDPEFETIVGKLFVLDRFDSTQIFRPF